MSRPTADDPLVPVPVRLPASLKARLKAEAAADGRTSISDVLRSYISLEAVKPLGTSAPRRRIPKLLSSVSGHDPALLREIASLGGNLNQIARRINGQALAGDPIDALELS